VEGALNLRKDLPRQGQRYPEDEGVNSGLVRGSQLPLLADALIKISLAKESIAELSPPLVRKDNALFGLK
jgi:hypothetical protein